MQSELYETTVIQPHDSLPARLPIFIAPEPAEALSSWLLRLGEAMELPPMTLMRRAFGIESRGDPHWWRRPGEKRLSSISARTAVSVDRLRDMTFEGWPLARGDELYHRFHARRKPHWLGPGRSTPLAICLQCFAESGKAFIRRDWMVGWISCCPRHRSVLTAHCPSCRETIRMPSLSSIRTARISRCARCNASFVMRATESPAINEVVRLQGKLLSIKRRGVGEMRGLGVIDWPMLMALIDMIIGAVWHGTADEARERLFDRIVRDLALDREHRLLIPWAANYGASVLLAWLFEDWSRRLSDAIAILRVCSADDMIARIGKLDDEQERSVRSRLPKEVLDRRPEPPSWPRWLETLPDADVLMERANSELHMTYYKRLTAIAMLRGNPDIAAVARETGTKPETMQRWAEFAAMNGLDALVARPLRRCDLTRKQSSNIQAWLTSVRRTAGPTGWSAEHTQKEIAARFGIRISATAAHYLLKKHHSAQLGPSEIALTSPASPRFKEPVRI